MKPTKILIVEDEIITARDISLKLQKLDYQVVGIADSGNVALEKVAEYEPDLVLMDIVLQGDIDGIEVAQQVRHSFNIPVIYLTAYVDQETLQRAKITEPFGYILKPFKGQELRTHIEIALYKHKSEIEIRRALAKQKELNELKSRFITLASHEFRTPLTAILGSTELLRHYGESLPQNKINHYLEKIKATIKGMTNTLDSILTLSQAEADKIIFKPVPLNLGEVCQDVVREFQGDEEEEKRIVFIDKCLLNSVLADKNLIRYIMTNLLVNAIKYSPKNSKILFSLICQQEEAILTIEDRGIGIPSEELDKLFDSFYRASNVGDIPGTGLGLSVVKQLVDLHGGNIKVESELAKGTTFTVALPLG